MDRSASRFEWLRIRGRGGRALDELRAAAFMPTLIGMLWCAAAGALIVRALQGLADPAAIVALLTTLALLTVLLVASLRGWAVCSAVGTTALIAVALAGLTAARGTASSTLMAGYGLALVVSSMTLSRRATLLTWCAAVAASGWHALHVQAIGAPFVGAHGDALSDWGVHVVLLAAIAAVLGLGRATLESALDEAREATWQSAAAHAELQALHEQLESRLDDADAAGRVELKRALEAQAAALAAVARAGAATADVAELLSAHELPAPVHADVELLRECVVELRAALAAAARPPRSDVAPARQTDGGVGADADAGADAGPAGALSRDATLERTG